MNKQDEINELEMLIQGCEERLGSILRQIRRTRRNLNHRRKSSRNCEGRENALKCLRASEVQVSEALTGYKQQLSKYKLSENAIL